MREVIMPAQGMAMTEGVLVKWLKQPGDTVCAGEPIAEIETDKANMELESPVTGRLGPHLVEAGATVPVGKPIVRILEEGDTQEASSDLSASSSELDDLIQPQARQITPKSAEPTISPPVSEPVARATSQLQTIPEPPKRRRATNITSVPNTLETDRRLHATLLEEAQPSGVDLSGLPTSMLIEWLETMVLIREFEEVADQLASAGKIPGGMHSAAGQEAVAVGAIRALLPTDIVTSSHRSHHHSLAKGLTPRAIMAELYGKVTGCLGGRGGHMHLADFSIGLFGSNGIVGAGLGIAMGAALGAKMRDLDQVALGFFGDGGVNTGRVWEYINLAALWQLPLIVICENNLYAVETHIGRAMAGESIVKRAAGFGLPALQVDGQDVTAMYRATLEARQRAAEGEGPTFIEAQTYRYRGHNTGDPENYRDRAEVEYWRRTEDPIERLRHALESDGLLTEGQFHAIVQKVQAVIQDAINFAEQSPWPDPATARDNVTGLQVDLRGNL